MDSSNSKGISRRRLLAHVLTAPSLAISTRPGAAKPAEKAEQPLKLIETSKYPVDVAPRHAVFVLADETIPEPAVQHQCEVFAREGLLSVGAIVPACSHLSEVHVLADACEPLLDQWRSDRALETITLLVWCPLASPLRWLVSLIPVNAAVARLYGPIGNSDDGHEYHNHPEYERRVPRNSPSDLAFNRFSKAMKRYSTAMRVSTSDEIDLTPDHYDDLPLVNGFMLGEVDDDPRLM